MSNSNDKKPYASLTTLQTFLDNLKKLFATKTEISETIAHSDNNLATAKSYSDSNINTAISSANTYTDNALSQKTQVQFITWGDTD